MRCAQLPPCPLLRFEPKIRSLRVCKRSTSLLLQYRVPSRQSPHLLDLCDRYERGNRLASALDDEFVAARDPVKRCRQAVAKRRLKDSDLNRLSVRSRHNEQRRSGRSATCAKEIHDCVHNFLQRGRL